MKSGRSICWAMVTLLCMVGLLVAVFTANPIAQAETDGYYTYTVFKDKATITGVDAAIGGEITIPSEVGGYPVAYVSRLSLSENITSVILPDCITRIEEQTFYACKSLKSVTIPNSVTSIGKEAFYFCKSLESITIPNSVISIEERAFLGCERLKSVVVPDSVTSIGLGAFRDCTGLSKITLPFVGKTLSEKGGAHFNYIFGEEDYFSGGLGVPPSLKEVVITKATKIGNFAFFACMNIKSITIPESVTSIEANAFDRCGVLTVNYQGTCGQWRRIAVKGNNEVLQNATLHCTRDSSSEHVYSNDDDTDCNVCDGTRIVATTTVSETTAIPTTVTMTILVATTTTSKMPTEPTEMIPAETDVLHTGDDPTQSETVPSEETSVTATGTGTAVVGQMRDDATVQEGVLPWVLVAVAACVLVVAAGTVIISRKKKG